MDQLQQYMRASNKNKCFSGKTLKESQNRHELGKSLEFFSVTNLDCSRAISESLANCCNWKSLKNL